MKYILAGQAGQPPPYHKIHRLPADLLYFFDGGDPADGNVNNYNGGKALVTSANKTAPAALHNGRTNILLVGGNVKSIHKAELVGNPSNLWNDSSVRWVTWGPEPR